MLRMRPAHFFGEMGVKDAEPAGKGGKVDAEGVQLIVDAGA